VIDKFQSHKSPGSVPFPAFLVMKKNSLACLHLRCHSGSSVGYRKLDSRLALRIFHSRATSSERRSAPAKRTATGCGRVGRGRCRRRWPEAGAASAGSARRPFAPAGRESGAAPCSGPWMARCEEFHAKLLNNMHFLRVNSCQRMVIGAWFGHAGQLGVEFWRGRHRDRPQGWRIRICGVNQNGICANPRRAAVTAIVARRLDMQPRLKHRERRAKTEVTSQAMPDELDARQEGG